MTLARRTPLRRAGPIKPKRARRIDKRKADRPFVAWLHTQPCVGAREFPAHVCEGRLEMSHIRNHTGLGLKPPDIQALPMCSLLHHFWETHWGWFKDMCQEERMKWAAERLIEQKARWELAQIKRGERQ